IEQASIRVLLRGGVEYAFRAAGPNDIHILLEEVVESPPSRPTTTRKSSKIDTSNSNSSPLPLLRSNAPETGVGAQINPVPATVPPSIVPSSVSTHSVSPGIVSTVPHMATVPATNPFAPMFSSYNPSLSVPAQDFHSTAPAVPTITSACAMPAQDVVVPEYLNVDIVDIYPGEGDRTVAWNDWIKFWVTVFDKASGTVLTQEKRANPKEFRVGSEAFIKGFDQGLVGLRLNGCRDITIPFVVHAAHVCGIRYRNPAIGDGDWII
ncbi:hypothetical protein C0992_009423, partial [Termitomyces sp. T32_za158]